MTTIAPGMARRNDRIETVAVAAAVVAVALAAVLYAWAREAAGARAPRLLDWQVSAFSGLGPDDQAIHSALSVAAEEIGWMNYDFGDWPAPDELDKLLMPPFYKDEFWKSHGSVRWGLPQAAAVYQGGDTSYIGTGGGAPGQSAYLLVFRHRHVGATYSNQTEIWVHRDSNRARPESFKPEVLIKDGWRQVVAYSGADETARLKGK